MNGFNPLPIDVLYAESLPTAFLPEPPIDKLRLALERIATNPEMTRDGMRDLAKRALSHLGSSTCTPESHS